MHKEHPLRRALALAAAVTAVMLAAGDADLTRWDRPANAVIAALTIPGAFLASLPARLRRRDETKAGRSFSGCARSFLGGALLALGLYLGGGSMLAGLLQGSVSAFAFLLCAWAAGFLFLRMTGRRRA